MSSTPRTIADAHRFGKMRLARTASETPGLDAEVLLRHALGIGRAAFFAMLADPIEPGALTAYLSLIADRARGVPVSYLTGEREFMGLPFAVGPEVLIPRPETEILVEWALTWLNRRPGSTVVDVGTGSGAIALSLAALLPPDSARIIVAVDVSDEALAMAARNRARLGLEDRVTLVQGSLLDPIAIPVDLVLANLPYLHPGQIDANPHLAAEPRLALDGGADGLDLIRLLLRDAPRVVAPAAAIALEIDPSQRRAVVALAPDVFPRARVDVLPDLAGFDRHVVIAQDANS